MWGAYRWAARILLLVMFAPAFMPMAMACAAQPGAMHCARRSMTPAAAQQSMPCHHAMGHVMPPQSEAAAQSSQFSFQASNDDDCCSHHCCCDAINPDWAQPASNFLSFSNLLIEPAQTSRNAEARSIDISRQDSARAPPSLHSRSNSEG
jgi:hypothetical protein